MEIFSNWIFWVVLASIVFVLALIGYLTESMKKDKKDDKKKDEASPVPEVSVPETPETNEVNIPAQNDDWTTMPKVDAPLDEVKVDTISEVTDEPNSIDNLATSPVSDENEVPSPAPVTSEPQGLNVETPVMSNDSVFNNSNVDATLETPSLVQDTSADTTQTTPVETLNTNNQQTTPVETLNTDDSQTDKNSDIWNL